MTTNLENIEKLLKHWNIKVPDWTLAVWKQTATFATVDNEPGCGKRNNLVCQHCQHSYHCQNCQHSYHCKHCKHCQQCEHWPQRTSLHKIEGKLMSKSDLCLYSIKIGSLICFKCNKLCHSDLDSLNIKLQNIWLQILDFRIYYHSPLKLLKIRGAPPSLPSVSAKIIEEMSILNFWMHICTKSLYLTKLTFLR